MNNEKYGQYIKNLINMQPYGVPIYSEKVAEEVALHFHISTEKAKQITNVTLKRIADNDGIERFHKGIYYKAKNTAFGKQRLNNDAVVYDMLTKSGNKIIGYETGPSLLNKIGLTTLVPKKSNVATNLHNKRFSFENNVIVKKPIAEVKNENVRYLQALDVIALTDKISVDADNPNEVIRTFLNKNDVDKDRLILYARKHYNESVLVKTIDITLGDL